MIATAVQWSSPLARGTVEKIWTGDFIEVAYLERFEYSRTSDVRRGSAELKRSSDYAGVLTEELYVGSIRSPAVFLGTSLNRSF